MPAVKPDLWQSKVKSESHVTNFCLSGGTQVKQLSRQQSSISQQVVTVLQFCSNLFVYLALIFQLLLQGGFSSHGLTILVIPLATLQGLKVCTASCGLLSLHHTSL